MRERTNLRKKIVHEKVTTTGTAASQALNFVVPDGMLMEILGVQVGHNNGVAVSITILTVDENTTEIIRYTSQSCANTEYASAPQNEAAASQLKARVRQHGEPIVIPARHALQVLLNAVAADKESYVWLNYVLKPYTFTNELAT